MLLYTQVGEISSNLTCNVNLIACPFSCEFNIHDDLPMGLSFRNARPLIAASPLMESNYLNQITIEILHSRHVYFEKVGDNSFLTFLKLHSFI